MSSKIGGTRPTGRIANIRRYPAPATQVSISHAAGEVESVTLTVTAETLTSLQRAVDTAPEIDAQRIENVRQAIARGEYRVDANRIAAAVMRMEGHLPRD